jgi:hypothetical protein
MAYHWLSFCDPGRPRGSQFLGCSIVEAPDFLAAVTTAHALGCNPGGECQGVEFTTPIPPPEYVGRLLDRVEAGRLENIWAQ